MDLSQVYFLRKKLGRYLISLSPILAALYLIINKNAEDINYKILKVFIF